jgi:hypothetical protein
MKGLLLKNEFGQPHRWLIQVRRFQPVGSGASSSPYRRFSCSNRIQVMLHPFHFLFIARLTALLFKAMLTSKLIKQYLPSRLTAFTGRTVMYFLNSLPVHIERELPGATRVCHPSVGGLRGIHSYNGMINTPLL